MKILEEIWLSCLADKKEGATDEEKRVLSEIIEREDKLREYLGEENEEILDEYNERQIELSVLYEKNAFIIGVRFALRLLAESLLE